MVRHKRQTYQSVSLLCNKTTPEKSKNKKVSSVFLSCLMRVGGLNSGPLQGQCVSHQGGAWAIGRCLWITETVLLNSVFLYCSLLVTQPLKLLDPLSFVWIWNWSAIISPVPTKGLPDIRPSLKTFLALCSWRSRCLKDILTRTASQCSVSFVFPSVL